MYKLGRHPRYLGTYLGRLVSIKRLQFNLSQLHLCDHVGDHLPFFLLLLWILHRSLSQSMLFLACILWFKQAASSQRVYQMASQC